MSQHRPARAAVFPAGSRGTALAKIMADAGTDVIVHARRSEIADAITTAHRNPGYFPDVELPHTMTATTDPAVAPGGADFLVLSIPAQSLRANLATWAPHIGPETLILSLMKGIERGSGLRASQVITEVTGVSADRVAVLSGPNLAPEIMDGRPAAATIACRTRTPPAASSRRATPMLPAVHQHRRHRLRPAQRRGHPRRGRRRADAAAPQARALTSAAPPDSIRPSRSWTVAAPPDCAPGGTDRPESSRGMRPGRTWPAEGSAGQEGQVWVAGWSGR